jgi:hypothetical protein
MLWTKNKMVKQHQARQRQRQRQRQQQQQKEEEQRRQDEQTPHFYCQLKPTIPYEGPKPRRWNALVQWDPHLFPPTHGYYLLKDYQGKQRFVKVANILQSSNPRRSPCKLHFSPDVSVKIIDGIPCSRRPR